ncbi:MAG: tRNA uracil 4-sulfurtransferase ThiI [archaeon]
MYSYLIRYDEIFLKSSAVRRLFERTLINNIKRTCGKVEIKKIDGRIVVFGEENLEKNLGKIFGIVSFSPVEILETVELEEILKYCSKFNDVLPKNCTFAVRVKKVGGGPSSLEIAAKIGNLIKRKVDLENPDFEIQIEIRDKHTFIYQKIIPGLGGLPVGVSGKVLCLISGGIDSPVAAWLAMKRGCLVDFIHFHSFPIVSKKSIDKTKSLIKILKEYNGCKESICFFVPFGDIQIYLRTKVDPKYLIVLYRRAMLKIASEIAKKYGYLALVTGENLAQVSSQTLENLTVIQESIKIPILRPLLTFDKKEIIETARKIGTYETSIIPQEDCCTLFTPKHSSAKVNLEKVKEFEKKTQINKLIKKTVKQVSLENI